MKLLRWCKANAMPVIAVLAAAVTAVFVPPDAAYLGYYDVHSAELRRQPGRYADALRQSPEPVSVQPLQHP